MKTDREILPLWYDNQFGKDVSELSEDEIKCLTGTHSFKVFSTHIRMRDSLREVVKAIKSLIFKTK